MTVYLSNAFSLSMINAPVTIKVLEAGIDNVKDIISDGFVSAIGHEATAQVITSQLGVQVSVNRISVKIVPGDVLIVFQLLSRLPEGKILSEDEMRQIPAKWYFCFVAPF
jgi:hypothetical protein